MDSLDYVDVTYIIEVSCPRNVLDKINYYGPDSQIRNAITWVLGHSSYSLNVTYLRQPIDMGPDWRSRLSDLAEHEGVEAIIKDSALKHLIISHHGMVSNSGQ